MALHNFVPGESANVAENIDANFSYLLNLIQGNAGSVGTAVGSSTAVGRGVFASSGRAVATGTSTATATSGSASLKSSVATATGSATVAAFTTGSSEAVATATGTSTATGFENAGSTSVAAATGVADGTVVGSRQARSPGTATGTVAVVATSARQLSTVGTATGTSATNGVGSGSAVESPDGTTNTGPTDTIIFASNNPGTASATLNSFSLTASPGTITFNGSSDTSVPNAVELYYAAHVLYVENVAGNWFRWASANTWTSTANPIPVVITESVEGKILTTSLDTIYASSTIGTAAPTGATVANGQLITFTITANPGQVVRSGSTDLKTANVVQLYYHNHDVWQQNSAGGWWSWNGDLTNNNGWTPQATSPVPTTPTINVAIMLAQTTNQTFTVSGTYQDFTGTGNPTLQYTNNLTKASATTKWNSTDETAGITLSNNALTASSTVGGSSTSVRSTTSFSTGKKIFEITGSTLTTNWTAGIADAAFGLTTGLGDTTDSFAFQPNLSGSGQGLIYNGAVISSIAAASANGDKFTFCVDFGAKKIWVTSTAMRNAGFPWNNDLIGAQNPANGTGGIAYTFTTAGFICFNEFDTGGVAVMNTVGPFAVSTPAGFSSWDTASTNVWSAFPSTVSVTPTTWSFVHPPVTTQQSAANVAVRDANNTGTIGVSNSFQIQAPAVVTLSPMSLDKATVTANQPGGALVGNLSIPTSGGSFTGTVTTNNSNFQVTGTGNTRQLVTTAVLGVNAGIPITLTANQTGAINTGETLNVTIVVTAESPTATAVTTVGPTIVGSSTPGTAGGQLTWALVTAGTGKTNFQIKLNTVTQTFSNAVSELYYINHTLYYATAPTSWFAYNGTAPVSGQLAQANFPSSSSPIPVLTPSGTTFQPNTNGPTGITFTLVSAGTAMSNVTWTEDSVSFNFVGNALSTTGSLQAGTYTLNVTATVA